MPPSVPANFNSVLAVVVSYQPCCATLAQLLAELARQGCAILLVDNGSDNVADIAQLPLFNPEANSGANFGANPAINTEQPAALLKPLAANLGLGAAHNVGIAHARAQGYDYVLIMDQDSMPLDGMVAALLTAHRCKSLLGAVSAVGAHCLNPENGDNYCFVRFGKFKYQRHYCDAQDRDGCVAADFLISSGSLIAIKTIDAIGGMDEGLFIDMVDIEWFLRAHVKGFKAFGVCDAVMQHSLGEKTPLFALGKRQRYVSQHQPFRYYYIFRNSINLCKRGYVSFAWKRNDMHRLAMLAVIFGCLQPPRRANLAMMIKGVWHGLRGKQGRLATAADNIATDKAATDKTAAKVAPPNR